MRSIALICLWLCLTVAEGAGPWEIRKDKDGIQVYTRKVEHSSFDEYKAITTIPNCTTTKFLQTLLNIDNYKSLLPDCLGARVVEQVDSQTRIQYLQLKAPWPVMNRDALYEQKVMVNEHQKSARIQLDARPEKLREEKGFVRVKKGTGYWDIREDSNGNVHIVHQFHAAPGGGLPAWLVNWAVATYPYELLNNLRIKLNVHK